MAQTLPVALASRLRLAWSHYVTLLTIDNPEERQSTAKDRDTGQFGDTFEALPTFLPEAEGNWSENCRTNRHPWRPLIALLTIDNPEERRFYELESESAEVQYL